MTQEERRIYLIRTLLQAELPQYLGIEIPTGKRSRSGSCVL